MIAPQEDLRCVTVEGSAAPTVEILDPTFASRHPDLLQTLYNGTVGHSVVGSLEMKVQMLEHCRGVDSIVKLMHLLHSGVDASSPQ